MRTPWLLVLLFLAVLAGGCGGAPAGTPAASPVPTEAAGLTPTVDCTAANSACPEIVVQGDAPATFGGAPSPARGYVDPSIRKDPASNTLWMAYSWPHLQTEGPSGSGTTGVAVDNHLARSDDGGATWQFAGPMWTAQAETGDAGEPGWLNTEAVSLAPAQTASGTVWYSVRDSEFIRPASAGGADITGFTLRVAMASSPAQLAQAEEVVLGGDLTAPYWNADFNLDSLSQELSGCALRDAGLFYQNGTLYLAAECSLFTRTGERTEDEFVALFATQPNGGPKSWNWRYLGKLAGRAEAQELGGEMLQQTEIDVGPDGRLIALLSPSKPSSPLATHFGCRAVEVASLDPPRLARDGAGNLIVRASVTASDQAPSGPGACTYDAASATGLVLARRQLKPGLIVSLNSTGLLRP